MKKLLTIAATLSVVVCANAAAVGWSIGGLGTTYANDAYSVFVLGQNGVASTSTITALLDAGNDISSYAFANSTVAANGAATVAAASSGKSLDAGTYTMFMVLFDSATPTAGTSKYVLLDGAATLTKTIASTAATVTFAAGNVSSTVGNASNWSSYGAVPEPTSGLLMLVGLAGLALRRRRA